MGNNTGFQLARGVPEIYEKVLVPLWFGRWAKALLELVEIQPGEAVLDVACGTGVTTRLAQEAVGDGGHVTGLDINAPMLAIARDLAQGSAIDWIEGDVAETGLDSGTVDAVISQHGYHYFPDKARALAEIHRVLAPGGRIAFSIWDGHSAYTSALCAAVEKHISPEIADKQRSQRVTPNSEELVLALENGGFGKAGVHKQTLDIRVPLAPVFVPLHLGSMPIAGAFNALSEPEKDALVGDVEDALAEYVQDDELVYPDTVNVAMGYK
ncbi:MAG: methyltransferase domain-containing protein [Hyphomicrobiales bacterium]|nr:methyltransferase domain-containing protein [Hyphomicrobiales bacterium]MCP4998508.1 methyltransferase domain-containing protein [Hyphomicrobiales bacterium]